MSIQDKLTAIADNVPKVYEAGIAEGKNSIYETITITSDITNTLEFFNMANSVVKEGEEIVMFVRKDYNSVPPSDLDGLIQRGTILWYLWVAPQYLIGSSKGGTVTQRWMDNAYNVSIYSTSAYTGYASAGTEFIKVVIK